MKEKEKMLAGEVYSAVDPELIEELMATREVLYEWRQEKFFTNTIPCVRLKPSG